MPFAPCLLKKSGAPLRLCTFFTPPPPKNLMYNSHRECAQFLPVIKMLNSIWASTQLPHFPALEGDHKTDVLVIGGGMAGLLCAHRLTKAGIDVTVAEADRIYGGVTGKTTAKITSQHGLIYHKLLSQLGKEQAKLYLQAHEDAVKAYYILCKQIPCHFESQSAYVYAMNDRKALEQELHAFHLLGYPAGLKEDIPLPFRTAGAVKFKRQAQFHPLEFAAHIAKDLNIFECTPVRRLEGTTAITDNGSITAKKVIVATHFPFLNRHGSYFLKLYQQRSYVLALENTGFSGGMYIGAEENSLSFRSCGDLLLLGGGGHRTGKKGGNWQYLSDFATNAYPNALEVARWATQDCMSLDGIAYIGQYSKNTPNLFVATGFNKWGMTGSMVAATVLTDLVQEKESPYADLFSPSRSILRPQLFINGAESTLNLLRPTVPRCPHLGCALKWNSIERSWDCPCHGSRFSESGQLLDDPAQKDLNNKPSG